MYYDFSQEVRNLPGHRMLAVNRGEREEFLKVTIRMDEVAIPSAYLERAFVRDGQHDHRNR